MIIDKIRNSVVSQARANKRRPKQRTASVILSCRRWNYYAIKGYQKQPDPEYLLQLKFSDGNLHHEDLANKMANAKGIKVLDTEYGVVGKGIYARLDAIVSISCDGCDQRKSCWWLKVNGEPPEGGIHNVEAKSMFEDSFRTFVKYGIKAFPGYYAQCQVMACSEPIRPSIVIGKNKNSSDLWEELIEPDWDYIEKLSSDKAEFDYYLARNTAPPRDFGYRSPMCQSCEFLWKCWFSNLKRDLGTSTNIPETQKKAIRQLHERLLELEEAHNAYCEVDSALRDYVAFLHVKHSFRKIRLPQVTSSVVETTKTYPNWDYIESILDEEQLEKSRREKKSTFYRTTIR